MSTQQLKAIATGRPEEGKKSENPVASFSKFLDTFKPQIKAALPAHMNPDRMTRLALTAFSTMPALRECSPSSIIQSLMNASQMGLEPGVNGQGYLIPYKGDCTFVPGWKGINDLSNRSGRSTTWTGAVYAGDEFDYALGDAPFVKHKPGVDSYDGKLTHVYAIGRARGAEFAVIEVWPIGKVWKHRDRFNKVGSKHYSYTHPEMYARKIALLQVLKYMPQSIELQTMVDAAHAAEAGAYTIDGAGIVLPVDDQQGGEPPQGPAGDHERKTETPAGQSFAQLADRLERAKDREVSEITLDESRHLPPEQQAELAAIVERRFPRAK